MILVAVRAGDGIDDYVVVRMGFVEVRPDDDLKILTE